MLCVTILYHAVFKNGMDKFLMFVHEINICEEYTINRREKQ